MIFITNQKGYVSKVEQKNGMTFASVSTSVKDKRTDEWVKSYWDFKFINENVHEGKITIISGGIENKKSPKDGKYYKNFTAFKWEQEENSLPSGFQALEDDDDIPAFLK
jgi:hypothetical protein